MKTFIVLLLLSTSAFATDFMCEVSLNNEVLESKTVTVVDEQMTEMSLENFEDINFVGNAMFNQVSVFLIFDGVNFGSIGMYEASKSMYMIGKGELSLYCRLD